MGFVHDDDDPFYDHDEATRVNATAPPPPASTLHRVMSTGRPTATFDAFLSDSSDSDDENDDGAALERMQGQADDMEYIGSTFRLDSPNGSFAGGNDTSFRMDMPPAVAVAAETTPTAVATPPTTTTAAWVARMSRASSMSSGDSDEDNSSAPASVSQPLEGLSESFGDARPSVDGLDSSFRLFSPNAVAAEHVSSPGTNSGVFSDSSFVLNSPPETSDSFTSDRPSNLDAGYTNSFGDSFLGNRPSNLDAGDSNNFDDSFTSDRPSNLDALYNETLDDSFASNRPSNLVHDSLDDSFASERPSTLARDSLDLSFAGVRPSTLRARSPGTASIDVDSVPVPTPIVSSVMATPSIPSIQQETNADSRRASAERDRFSESSLNDATAMELNNDVSFRLSSPDGDHWETNDSISSEPTSFHGNDANVNRSSSSFVAISAFGAASQSFQHDNQSSNADARPFGHEQVVSDVGYRISTESAVSFGSTHHSFFVGSVGSEADSMASYPLLASSPALSDVAMLGDDHGASKSVESSYLGQRSRPLHASDDEARTIAWQSAVQGSETVVTSPTSLNEQLPLLPIAVKSASSSAATRKSTLLKAADSGDDNSLSRRSSSAALGSSSVRQSKSSTASAIDALGASLLYRLSSPNAHANAATPSFISHASDDAVSKPRDSFSSSSSSEVAARHLNATSADPSDGTQADNSAETQPDGAFVPLTAAALAANGSAHEHSVGGGRPTDEKLDFTGVYRSSGQSRDGANASRGRRNTVAKAESRQADGSSFLLMTTPVALVRARSDSVQRASERKVEDFFRRTRKFTMADDDADLRATQSTRQTRARTTVVELTLHEEHDEEKAPQAPIDAARGRSQSAATKKLIDLKSLRSGAGGVSALQRMVALSGRSRAVSRASTRLQIKEDLLEVPASPALGRQSRLTFQSSSSSSGASSSSIDSVENRALAKTIETLQATRGRQLSAANDADDAGGRSRRGLQRPFAHSISSEARSADSPNMIPMPPRYMLSPNAHAHAAVDRSDVKGTRFAASASGNAMTPTLPSLAMGGSSLTPSYGASSPFASSFATLSGAKTPLFAMSGGASGFKWNAQEQLQHHHHHHHLDMRSDESGGLSMKESIWHETAIPRPTLSEAVASHLHRFSSSVRHTLRRTGARLFGPHHETTTSPKSVCSSPPKLARAFDDSNFYARFGRDGGVGDSNDVAATKHALARQRNTEQAWKKTVLTAVCALVGLVLGLVLIHVDSLGPTLTLSRAEQLQQQRVNGALSIATTTAWILLPGQLFLRVWTCATLPLLFCHVLNGAADLAMHRKAQLALSFRSLGYMLAVSVIAAVEGVGMVAVVDALGLFRTDATTGDTSVQSTAAALRSRLGAVERVNSTVALQCEFDRSYLQALNDGRSFRCSNKTIPLPVYDGASESNRHFSNNHSTNSSSAAIFVLQDVNRVLETTSSRVGTAYYPHGSSLSLTGLDTVAALVPPNAADALVRSSPVTTVAIALVLGLVCGKRAYERRLAAKAARQDPEAERSNPVVKPFYVLGAMVELQLALEWIVDGLEWLAPVGVLSLVAGTMVLHREELLTVVRPMVPLVLSVSLACCVHVVLVAPALLRFGFGVQHAFVPSSWASATTFLPAYVLCVGTGSVVLSLPIVHQCYARASNDVTKSMAHVSVGVLSVLHRSAHALYLPLAVLWLLQTSAPPGVDVVLTTRLCLVLGGLAVGSCFVAPVTAALSGSTTNGGTSTLVLIMTIWRAVVAFSDDAAGASSSPPTLPLLVACDVVLARVVAATNLHGNMLVARMIAEHCDEVVVVVDNIEEESSMSPAIRRGRLAPAPQNGWL